ncbi:DUF5667 domain-containing protein [Patescibacteria group bacterium]
MVKKTFLTIAALLFALGVLGTSAYRASSRAVVEALENNQEMGVVLEIDESEEASVEANSPVDYTLAWPGILPDHFLYPAKMIRDRIWLFLTTDAQKKAELLLKLADKRIWSAQMLAEKENEELAITTATKAEKYLERAMDQAKVAQEKGKQMSGFWTRLELASQKHEETLLNIKGKVADENKGALEGILKYPQQVRERVRERSGEGNEE